MYKSMFLSDFMYFSKNMEYHLLSKMFLLHKQVYVELNVDPVVNNGSGF